MLCRGDAMPRRGVSTGKEPRLTRLVWALPNPCAQVAQQFAAAAAAAAGQGVGPFDLASLSQGMAFW
jgi:hypothetical protein